MFSKVHWHHVGLWTASVWVIWMAQVIHGWVKTNPRRVLPLFKTQESDRTHICGLKKCPNFQNSHLGGGISKWFWFIWHVFHGWMSRLDKSCHPMTHLSMSGLHHDGFALKSPQRMTSLSFSMTLWVICNPFVMLSSLSCIGFAWVETPTAPNEWLTQLNSHWRCLIWRLQMGWLRAANSQVTLGTPQSKTHKQQTDHLKMVKGKSPTMSTLRQRLHLRGSISAVLVRLSRLAVHHQVSPWLPSQRCESS